MAIIPYDLRPVDTPLRRKQARYNPEAKFGVGLEVYVHGGWAIPGWLCVKAFFPSLFVFRGSGEQLHLLFGCDYRSYFQLRNLELDELAQSFSQAAR